MTDRRTPLVYSTVALLALAMTAPAFASPTGTPEVPPEHTAARTADAYSPVTTNGYVRQPYGVPTSRSEDDLPPVVDDPTEPFDFYRYPRNAVGVYGGPEEFAITPEGYVQNAFGTLTFAAGTSPEPVNQRVKTWKDGWLPVLDSTFDRDGVRNHIQTFAANVPGIGQVPYTQWWGNPRQELTTQVDNTVAFTRVELTNTGDETTTYDVVTDVNNTPVVRANQNMPTAANPGPARPDIVQWDSELSAVVGDGKLLYTASREPVSSDGETLTFRFTLEPGESDVVELKMPYWVAPASDAGPLRSAAYDTHLDETATFWEQTLDSASTDIDVPGEGDLDKVINTYKAGIVLSLIDMDILEGKYFWDANPTKYDNYWIRDAAFNINGILNAGFPELARENALLMLDYQKPNGMFESQPNQWDGNGQALWTFGMYVARTGDTEFAERVWPAVQRSMQWEWEFRQAAWDEAGGLFPYGFMPDNERVRGHVVGYDLIAIAGERGAVEVAKAVGEDATAQLWSERADQYEQILRDRLSPAVEDLGWIPPAIEGMQAEATREGWYGSVYGIDWGNLEVVWPSGVFEPNEKWVTDSLRTWRGKTREGLFTYPTGGQESILHAYTPITISDTYVRAGDTENALQDLYNLLVHTTATHNAAEAISSSQRWGWSKGDQTQPHGEFAGKYLTLLRDMLAVEQDGELRLGSALSPVWTRPGRHVSFSGDTDFGRVDYRMDVVDGGATVAIDTPETPNGVVLGLPVGVRVTGARLDGRDLKVNGTDPIDLGRISGAHTVELTWQPVQTPAADFSYPRAVSDYQANYAKANEPVELSLEKTRQETHPVRVGEEVTVSNVLVNTGGAGWLDEDQQPVLYIDGERMDHTFPAVSRGIGFNTPGEVISFDHLQQGNVRLEHTTRFCEPGEHTIAIGLGPDGPRQSVTVSVEPADQHAPAPQAEVSLDQTVHPLYPGESTTLSATVDNPSCEAITDVQVALDAPEGWTVDPATVELGTIQPGESATADLTFTAPDTPLDVAVQEPAMSVEARYGWSGTTEGTASTPVEAAVLAGVKEPYLSHASTEAWFGVGADDRLAIYAGGEDLWKTTDEFGTLFRADAVQGRTTVTTEVLRQGDTWPWAKAGLVLRNDLSEARSTGYVILAVTPGNGWAMQWDRNGDGLLDGQSTIGRSAYPSWLRLERDGDRVTGSYSTDGTTWHTVGTATVPGLADGTDAGVFATATNRHVPGAISGVEFGGLDITHP